MKRVCCMCFVIHGNIRRTTVSSTRCVLVAVAVFDIGVYGPRREARIECRHVCEYCSASIAVLVYFVRRSQMTQKLGVDIADSVQLTI